MKKMKKFIIVTMIAACAALCAAAALCARTRAEIRPSAAAERAVHHLFPIIRVPHKNPCPLYRVFMCIVSQNEPAAKPLKLHENFDKTRRIRTKHLHFTPCSYILGKESRSGGTKEHFWNGNEDPSGLEKFV